nr:hypothetical protein CFP56_30170 [Quercus suber]
MGEAKEAQPTIYSAGETHYVTDHWQPRPTIEGAQFGRRPQQAEWASMQAESSRRNEAKQRRQVGRWPAGFWLEHATITASQSCWSMCRPAADGAEQSSWPHVSASRDGVRRPHAGGLSAWSRGCSPIALVQGRGSEGGRVTPPATGVDVAMHNTHARSCSQ